MKRTPTPPVPEPHELRRQLQTLRTSVLRLHKALLDSERVEYEKTMGKIASPNHFLQLLVNDPWFAWLHPLSELIVSMDEALAAETPLTHAGTESLVDRSLALLVASESGEGFAKHYYEALQRDPDVIMAQAEIAKFRTKGKVGRSQG